MQIKPLKLEELTLEQKIGMLITARGLGSKENREFVIEMIKKRALGGLQIAVGPGSEKLAHEIREIADYPILIGADMEKGYPNSDLQIPSQMALAAIDDEELAYQFGAVSAIEAKKAGYSMIWGPIVDMLSGPAECKVARTLGDDPELVSRISGAIIKGFYDNGVLATAKHWPGGRDVNQDGHMFSNNSKLTEEEIISVDAIPYIKAIKDGTLLGVMTGHGVYDNIDEYPTTLSEKMVSILRKLGFDGMIITDSFAMLGILQRYGEKYCYGKSIAAGNDMILPNYRISFKESYDMMMECYKEGVFTEERLNDAVRHVIAAQNHTINPATLESPSDYQRECFDRISRECITVVKDENVPVVLDEKKKKLFIIVSANIYSGKEDGVSYEIGDVGAINSSNVNKFKSDILNAYPDADIVVISQLPSPNQLEIACTAASKAEEVVFVNFTLSRSYIGSETVTKHIINLMSSFENKLAAIIQLGNPYAMEDLPHFPRFIMAMGGNLKSVEYSLDVLKGKTEAKGKMPMAVKLK
ncbi:MAG: hypothetical protein IJW38_05540 [Clostridia bacterium]|nr:hypothetical protein [Clostridia bacterium]